MNDSLPAGGPIRRRHLARISLLLATVPLLFAIVAEAAWLSVVAALVQEFTLRGPTLGIPTLAAAVAAGVAAARLLAPRFRGRWPAAALVITVSAGVVGWLSMPEARLLLGVGDLAGALGAHPGGWAVGVAVLRGFAHARLPLREDTLARLVGAGIPGLALAAVVGGMVSEPWRAQFLRESLVATVVFLTSATLALALTRLTAVGADSGFDWRRNPAWLGLLVVFIVAAAVLAVPASAVAAPAIGLVVGVAIVPFLVVGFVAGFGLRTIRVLGGFVAAAAVLGAVLSLLGAAGPLPLLGPLTGGLADAAPPESGDVAFAGVGILLVFVAVVAVVILAWLWMRREDETDDDILETRVIDRGAVSARTARRRGRRRPAPADAVSAYLRLIDDLETRPALRRDPAETPAEHARRLRSTAGPGLGMDLLAADYALARFGELRLSAAEHVRAVGRWRALRARLLRGGR